MISSSANELRHVHKGQYVKVYTSFNTFEIGVVVRTTTADDREGKEVLVQVHTQTGFEISALLHRIRRAYLVILDLNGVLGYRCRAQMQTQDGKKNSSGGKMTFVHRPNLSKLLKYLFSNFLVGVWTSGEERNAVPIIDSVFGPEANYGLDFKGRLLFSMFRSDTTPASTPDKPYGTVKDLKKLFNQFPESFHAGNTLIIDDSVDKCSHPNNALCPSAFTEESHEEDGDTDGMLYVMDILQKVAMEDSLEPLRRAALERTHQRKEAVKVQLGNEQVQKLDDINNRNKEQPLSWATRDAIEAMFEDTYQKARKKVAEKDRFILK